MNLSIDTTLQSLACAVKGISSKETLQKCIIAENVEYFLENYPFEVRQHEQVYWYNNHPFNFMGNTVNFYRIMFNLLKNALYQIEKKHHGEVIIKTDKGGKYNLLRFKDTAGGVDKDKIKDIFVGFNTSKAEGTGIGLAFCQLAMQNM